MAMPVIIKDPRTDCAALVTEFGQLVTAPVSYSDSMALSIAVANQSYNFVEPSQSQRVVITDIILSTDKNVGASGAIVEIYESDAADSLTVSKPILSVEMLKNTSRDLIGLNLIASEGVWINAKSNDTNVALTLGYYKVPVL